MSLKTNFSKRHELSLNEGMVLCCLKDGKLSSGAIAEEMNLTCSNTSKVIKSVEERGYIERILGESDKRQMYFVLTEAGKQKLSDIVTESVDIPEILQPIVK